MTTRQTIKRFLEPVWYSNKLLLQNFILAVWVGIYGIYSVQSFEKLTSYIEVGNQSSFYDMLINFSVITCIYFIGIYCMRYREWVNLYRTDIKNMHRIYIKRFLTLDPTQTEKIGTGKRISTIESSFHTRTDLIIHGVNIGTRLVITLSYALYVFVSLNIWYGIGFIAIFIIIHRIASTINSKAIPYRKKRIATNHTYNAQLVKIIMSKFEILQNNKGNVEISKLDISADECTDLNRKENNYLVFINNIPLFLIQTIKISIYFIVGYMIFMESNSISQLVGYMFLIGLLEKMIGDSINYYRSFAFNFTTIESLREKFDSIPPIQGLEVGKEFIYKTGNISFEGLSFRYEEHKTIFDNFSINITGNKKTALVGPSGGGKSTLMKLIAGYLQPNSGSFIVNDQNLKNISMMSYYKNIGYLTQDPSVFDGTIRENLEYGLPNQSNISNDIEQNIKTVIPLAKCEWIYDLTNGIDTEIGERGVMLSGGQKQRLAIAKIMLKNPNIILLDEPTSALDSTNEKEVTEALNNLFDNKTVIIIAHRLQTVKNADDIIYINHGQVIERGTHTELIALGGEYYNMVELQSGF